MKNGMINKVSTSYFTLTVVAALLLLGSANFADAQSASRRFSEDRDQNGNNLPVQPHVVATDGSWNVNSSSVWSLATNWSGNNIADGVAATGNFLFDINATRTVTIDGVVASRTLGIMNIGDASNSYTIAASTTGTLTFDNGGSNAQINMGTSANNTISAPVVLTSSLNITNTSGNTLTVSGLVSGGGGLTNVSGATALQAVNSYSGNTTISGGSISVDPDATLGDGTGSLSLSGGSLAVVNNRAVSAVISNNINLTADSSIVDPTTTASILVNFSGTLTGSAGTLTFNNSGADQAGDLFDPRFSGGDFVMNRPIIITSAVGMVRLSDFNTTGTSHTYNGIISGNGSFRRSASNTGTGGLTVFTAANTYTGATAINDGTLQLGNGGATGSLSTSSVINFGTSSGRLKFNRNNAVVQGTDFSGAAITGTGSVEQAGSGTLTLNVANTYTGGTIISGGALAVNDFGRAHAPSGGSTLIATVDGALGGGNVSLTAAGVTLTLTGGATNNYISDNATLSMITGSAANLNFAGSDTINSLVLNGVAQAPGVHNSVTDSTFLFGTGSVLVLIPEPSTWVMTIVGAGLLLSMQRFRRKQS